MKKNKLNYIFTYLLIFFACLLPIASNWAIRTFNNVDLDQIFFYLKVPKTGTNKDVIGTFIKECFIPCLIFLACIILVLYILNRILSSSIYQDSKYDFKAIFSFMKNHSLFFSTLLLIVSLVISGSKFDLFQYIKSELTNSSFIEDNYVDPKEVKLEFPEEKRNLIYIYLESMEDTYLSKEQGGNQKVDLIPELSLLADQNIRFAGDGKGKGNLQIPGVGWTIAGMVAQTSGIPLDIPIEGNSYDTYKTFLPGVYSLGDILNKEGYRQMLMVGSDAAFGGRKAYFKQHGNYEIWDHKSAIKENKIPKDYNEWWGFEDEKLFSFAKEKLQMLAADPVPFNFTMLTADTHHPDGYVCPKCGKVHASQYENVISCSSKQVAEFITWIQQQPFYENTTIVLAGDHLSMNTSLFETIPESYQRSTFNTFIHSKQRLKNKELRAFSVVDLFPTTLASIGVDISGDRLGLGTNLFSDEKTLIEKYNFEKVTLELNKKSNFYNNQFLYE
ncbi:MAG: LTA synthase family protein [Erysipelotrichaceae bacterium]